MPVFPTYNAGSPAQAQRPVLEQDQRNRLDTSASLGALGNVAGQLRTANLPGIDPNDGQAKFAGMQQIGAGVSAIGQAMFNIREAEADARNYADVHAAQVAMDREAGEFEKWKMQNPDPRGWEKAWQDRAAAFQSGYFEGKELSPQAQEGIRMRMSAFTERQAVNVGVAAVKATTQQAREAMMADYERAVESGDAQSAAALAQYGFKQGWIGEDDAVRMEIDAQDRVEAKTVEELQNRKNTALLYGDIDGAREAVNAMPIRDDEKALELAYITQRSAYDETIKKAKDLIELDPYNAAKELNGEDFKNLRASDLGQLKDMAARTIHEEQSATVAGIKEDIALGAVPSPADLESRDDYRALSPRQQADVREYFKAGAQNDIAEFATLQRAIRSYDPGNDPRGFEKQEFERAIALRFEGQRAQELATVLQERASGTAEPLTPSQRVVSDIFSSIQDRYDAGELGEFRFTGNQITKREGENGEIFYTVPDDNPPPGRAWTKDGKSNHRIIELSERDRLKYDVGKTGEADTYEDVASKESAFSRFLNVQQQVERMVDSGELTEADEIQAKVNQLMQGQQLKALESSLQFDSAGRGLPSGSFGGISAGLFPAGSAIDPREALNQLGNATGY